MVWKTISSKITFKNSFIQVRTEKCQKTDGKIVENFNTVDRPDVAVIAAFTPEKEIILIKQYRHSVKEEDFELPAGYMEPGEDIKTAAQRELLEETGYKTENLEQIQDTFASAGIMSNHVKFFIGFNAKKIQEPNLDDDEEIELKVTPWEEALKLLENEKIKDLGSVAGILLAKEFLKKLSSEW